MTIQEIRVPDIGDFKDVPVIEILVTPGDTVGVDDPLVILESDKATLDVPSPLAGVVEAVAVKLGDVLSQGSLVLTLRVADAAAVADVVQTATAAPAAVPETALAAAVPSAPPPGLATMAPPVVAAAAATASAAIASAGKTHATPSLRHFARVLGVDLSQVPGTGVKGRIQKQDVEGYVKGVLTRGVAAPSAPADGGLDLLPWPKIDFTRFGPTETRPLSRIEKISGANLHRNWVLIPHVTNNDEADITELEAFRVQLNGELAASGVKVSMLTFLIKAAAAALKKFPKFNASLDGQGDDAQLVLKKYVNIGFAADTPNGLMVPVIRDVDRKGLVEIAREVMALAQTAREGKLKPEQMQGGCFSISSLGGVGGTSFTPIINAPEVAIMGISKAAMKPVWGGAGFVPRLILPLSLSWDHRVINGVDAASFNVYFASLLADMRRAML